MYSSIWLDSYLLTSCGTGSRVFSSLGWIVFLIHYPIHSLECGKHLCHFPMKQKVKLWCSCITFLSSYWHYYSTCTWQLVLCGDRHSASCNISLYSSKRGWWGCCGYGHNMNINYEEFDRFKLNRPSLCKTCEACISFQRIRFPHKLVIQFNQVILRICAKISFLPKGA